jgi:predicted GTPase
MESGLTNDREAMTEADAIVFVVDDNGMKTEPERSDRLLLSHG